MGWFKDFFFGDMDEKIDTYEDTSSRKSRKRKAKTTSIRSIAEIKCYSN